MYLIQRRGVWYFRRPIPAKLQPFVPNGNRNCFTVSLKTRSIREARRRREDHWEQTDRILDEAKAQARMREGSFETSFRSQTEKRGTSRQLLAKRPLEGFSKGELMTLVQKWFLSAKQDALERYRGIYHFDEKSDRERALSELAAQLSSLQKQDGAKPDFDAFAVRRRIIEDAGGFISGFYPGDAVETHAVWFTGIVREGLIRLNGFARTILETGVPPALDGGSPELTASVQHGSGCEVHSITLDELIERFEREPKRENVKQKTRDEFRLVYSMLRDVVGGTTPLRSITREKIKGIPELYRHLPAHSSRLYPGKSLKEAAELAKGQGKRPMERATLNKRMTLLSAVFRYAVREQLMPSSPADGLTLPAQKGEDGKKSFTVEQLSRIFQGPVFKTFASDVDARFVPNHRLRPHEFWTPLAALFQGFRMEEFLQLRPDDVYEQGNVACIRIREGEGQSLKTDASRRVVPLHPFLKKLGFLRFVEAVRKAGLPELFPEAKRGHYGNRSHNYSKCFNRYLAAIGVKAGRDQVFHSFRHTFVDGLRVAGIPEDVRRRLGGWKDKTSLEESYGGKVLPYLADQLAKLRYEGLDLSHLEAGVTSIKPRKP